MKASLELGKKWMINIYGVAHLSPFETSFLPKFWREYCSTLQRLSCISVREPILWEQNLMGWAYSHNLLRPSYQHSEMLDHKVLQLNVGGRGRLLEWLKLFKPSKLSFIAG